jgi:cell wall-associated NlpC family hydrolase
VSKVDEVIAAASAEIGKPYNYGDEGPSSFDCSGLMQWIFARVGIRLPRTAAQQQQSTRPVTSPLPGDLVFWGTPAHHVALYIGGGKMIAAPHAGARVQVQRVYGTPAGYGRVTGLGAAVDAMGVGIARTGGVVQDWLAGGRSVLLELAVVGLGLALVGLGVWQTSAGSRRRVRQWMETS